MASAKQIKIIHVLKERLCLEDEVYRIMLSGYGVKSSKELSEKRAWEFIYKLNSMLPEEKQYKLKYENLGIRYNKKLKKYYATPKQLRLIEALWMTSPKVDKKNIDSLRRFAKKITNKDALEWLLMEDIQKIVKAIKSL